MMTMKALHFINTNSRMIFITANTLKKQKPLENKLCLVRSIVLNSNNLLSLEVSLHNLEELHEYTKILDWEDYFPWFQERAC